MSSDSSSVAQISLSSTSTSISYFSRSCDLKWRIKLEKKLVNASPHPDPDFGLIGIYELPGNPQSDEGNLVGGLIYINSAGKTLVDHPIEDVSGLQHLDYIFVRSTHTYAQLRVRNTYFFMNLSSGRIHTYTPDVHEITRQAHITASGKVIIERLKEVRIHGRPTITAKEFSSFFQELVQSGVPFEEVVEVAHSYQL